MKSNKKSSKKFYIYSYFDKQQVPFKRKDFKNDLFFENQYSELAYDLNYFLNKMEKEEIDKMILIKAEYDKSKDYFFCLSHQTCYEYHKGICGKNCPNYSPKNKKNGCCEFKKYTCNPSEFLLYIERV